MLYVPRHLPNRLEYKVLSCITVHYQSRMASNEIASTPSHPPTVQAGQYGESELAIQEDDCHGLRLGVVQCRQGRSRVFSITVHGRTN